MAKSVYALIDCNNFFVSCERVFRPDLWGKPVAVLSNNDGCIVARSNEVKALGIPMGTPYFKYKKELSAAGVTLFSGNFPLYGDMSQRIVSIIETAAPNVEPYSVDESFVELSHLAGIDYQKWADDLRAKIWQWTGVPVSIGVASSKTLAKAAAEWAKKHDQGGTHVIVDNPARQEALLRWLPIGDVWGFGWRSVPKLHERGISTAWDLTQAPTEWVQKAFTIRGRKTQLELQGSSVITLEHERPLKKSLAHTRTFPHRVSHYYELESAVATFAAGVAVKLRQQGEVARGVMTFIRTGHHAEQRRAVAAMTTLPQGTAETSQLIKAALDNLQRIYDPDFGYKRAGVVLTDMQPALANQLTFWANDAERLAADGRLMAAVDALNARYGTRLIHHATEELGQAWRSQRAKRSPSYTTNWRELVRVKA